MGGWALEARGGSGRARDKVKYPRLAGITGVGAGRRKREGRRHNIKKEGKGRKTQDGEGGKRKTQEEKKERRGQCGGGGGKRKSL